MKLLLDTCVWGGVVEPLRRAGHEVDWSGNWEVDPGDEEILARAFSASRILVTLDKDFGELAIVRGLPHSGIFAWPASRHGSRPTSLTMSCRNTVSSSVLVPSLLLSQDAYASGLLSDLSNRTRPPPERLPVPETAALHLEGEMLRGGPCKG